MSHYRNMNEMDVEQLILLGGRVSEKHKFFKNLAMISPDFALPYTLLSNGKDLDEAKTDEEFIEKLLYWIGVASNMKNYTELTRLSMILGDTRKQYNLEGLKDELPTP